MTPNSKVQMHRHTVNSLLLSGSNAPQHCTGTTSACRGKVGTEAETTEADVLRIPQVPTFRMR